MRTHSSSPLFRVYAASFSLGWASEVGLEVPELYVGLWIARYSPCAICFLATSSKVLRQPDSRRQRPRAQIQPISPLLKREITHGLSSFSPSLDSRLSAKLSAFRELWDWIRLNPLTISRLPCFQVTEIRSPTFALSPSVHAWVRCYCIGSLALIARFGLFLDNHS